MKTNITLLIIILSSIFGTFGIGLFIYYLRRRNINNIPNKINKYIYIKMFYGEIELYYFLKERANTISKVDTVENMEINEEIHKKYIDYYKNNKKKVYNTIFFYVKPYLYLCTNNKLFILFYNKDKYFFYKLQIKNN